MQKITDVSYNILFVICYSVVIILTILMMSFGIFVFSYLALLLISGVLYVITNFVIYLSDKKRWLFKIDRKYKKVK